MFTIRRLCIALTLCALVATALPVRASAFTLEQILSTPFVDNLTASPDGTVLVWKVHRRGERNLFTNAGGTVHKITTYDTDDGQDIDDVQVAPSNDAVVYLRGGTGDNAGGDNINPLSMLPPPVRGIYMVGLSGGDPVQIGEGSHVVLSPRGDAVAWLKSGVLQIATLTKGSAGYSVSKPQTLQIRGQAQNPVWSPDGLRLAFTNTRNDHSYIIVYTPAEKRYVYATPDFSQDDFAAWSPDSKRVAFVRTPGARENESPYEAPSRGPWSIWVADAQSGQAHMAWQARRGMGSAFYFSENSKSQLLWMGGDNIAFLWEGDGWQHLYAVNAGGGPARKLTSGQFEVETTSLSLDRSTLFYATNEGDIDRRHIWQVGLDAHPRAVTAGTADQWSPTPIANGGVAYVDADYNVPTTVTIGGLKPSRLIEAPQAAEFPASELVQPQLVTFRAPDGLLIHAELFVPRTPGKHPAMIFDHGGPVRQMLPGFHYMEAYTNLYESNQYLVNRGFVVLSINYRSGIMYGHDFREPARRGWFGASEYQDVLAGAHWLQRQPSVDPARLGIYGLSYGGYLTAMGLARNSDVFKAGSDYAGVHNWATLFDADNGGNKVVGTPAQRQVAYDASPIATIDRWHSPVFLSQGDDDRNVAFSQGVDLATRLRDRGVHLETLVFSNETHENQVWADMMQQYQASADFLIRELRP
jgi:dipeptidyl aminopeptidase/acylaminoacyl peptidase